MSGRFAVGDHVQTPHGKGVVREVRNNGRLVVQVQQRAVVVAADVARPLASPQRPPPAPSRQEAPSRRQAATEVDLHGLNVEEALVRIDEALDAALLAGHAELRFIHGRTGGRLRGALQARLRGIPAVRGFRLDPSNPGVTIASF
jgi:DNA mismatch repair protein MutS2